MNQFIEVKDKIFNHFLSSKFLCFLTNALKTPTLSFLCSLKTKLLFLPILKKNIKFKVIKYNRTQFTSIVLDNHLKTFLKFLLFQQLLLMLIL